MPAKIKPVQTAKTERLHIYDRPQTVTVCSLPSGSDSACNNSGTKAAQTTYGYDSHGNLSSEAHSTGGTPATITRSITPNSYGVATASTDYNSNSTSYTNFTCGSGNTAFPQTITFPDSTSNSVGWSCYVALPTSVTDVNGHATGLSYDLMVRPTQITFPDGGWNLMSYTGSTELDAYSGTTSSTPSTSCTGCSHVLADLDGLARPTTTSLVNDPDGRTYVAASYDSNGRTSTVTNPYRGASGVGDTPTYDALNRVTRITHADTSHSDTGYGGGTAQTCSTSIYGYGYPTVYSDELSPTPNQRQTFTDALGRIIEADEPNSSGTLNVNTCYLYDVLGNLTEVDQGAITETRTYTYDMLSRLTSATTPEATQNTRHFCYTSSGSACATPDTGTTLCSGDPNAVCRLKDERGTTATFTYNNMNQQIGKAYFGDTAVSYSYNQASYNGLTIANGKGQRTGMSDASGLTAWSYDTMGRVLTERRKIGTIINNLSYTYYYDGSLKTVTYPSGRTVTYADSVIGRPTSAEDTADSINYVTSAHYAPQGALSSAKNGASITYSATYDANRMWPTEFKGATASTFFDLKPTFFTNTNVSGVTNVLNTNRTQTFVYDNLNRIVQGYSPASNTTYCWGQAVPPYGTDMANGYDRYGNLMKIDNFQTGNNCQSPPVPNLAMNAYNQFTTFGYDASGNVTSDGANTYTWTGEGLLKSAAGVTYTSDGDAKRVEKSSGTYYWFGTSGTVLAETNTGGSTQNEYIYFNEARVARHDSTTNVYYYFSDQIGTAQLITTATGTVCYDSDSTPFGYLMTYGTITCAQNYNFAGMERDSETGNDHTWFRGYEENLGRWMSPDPLGGDVTNPQSLNRYAYVLNNPTSLNDPLGLGDAGEACAGFEWTEFWFNCLEGTGGGGAGGGGGGDGFPCIDDPVSDPNCGLGVGVGVGGEADNGQNSGVQYCNGKPLPPGYICVYGDPVWVGGGPGWGPVVGSGAAAAAGAGLSQIGQNNKPRQQPDHRLSCGRVWLNDLLGTTPSEAAQSQLSEDTVTGVVEGAGQAANARALSIQISRGLVVPLRSSTYRFWAYPARALGLTAEFLPYAFLVYDAGHALVVVSAARFSGVCKPGFGG